MLLAGKDVLGWLFVSLNRHADTWYPANRSPSYGDSIAQV